MLDSLMGALQSSGGIDQMSRALGLGESDVTKVLSGALPAMLGGLTRNAASPDGASGLLGALDRDHDGSIADEMAKMGTSLLGNLFKQS